MLDPTQKDLLQSKTFWGALVAGVAAALRFLDIHIDAEAYTNDIVTFVGLIFAVYGRVSARDGIGSVGGKRLKNR